VIPTEQSYVSDGWQRLLRCRKPILVSAALGLVLGLLVTVCTRPVYRATARIEVHRAPSRSPLTGELIDSDNWQSDNVTLFTAAAQLTNKAMLERAAIRMIERGDLRATDLDASPIASAWSSLSGQLHLPTLPWAAGSRPSVATGPPRVDSQRLADWLLEFIRIQPIRDTRLVTVQAEHWDPACARRIVTAVVETFMESEALQRTAADTTRVVYLRRQLAIAKERIERADREALLSPDTGLPALQARQSQVGASITNFTDAYLKAKTDHLTVAARLDMIRSLTPDALETAQDPVLQSGSLVQLRQDLLRCQSELAQARQIYKDKHPRLIQLLSQEKSIRDDIRRELDAAIASLAAEQDVLMAREQSLKEAIAQAQEELHGVQGRMSRSSTRESALQRDRELYGLLLARVQESEIVSAVQTPLTVLTQPATVGDRPVRPRGALNLALGVVVGTLSGGGLALMREATRRRIRTPYDVKDHLELPVPA
jgi:uncharacterized protein involved in exopolysaccharide biosynthesis